MERPKIEQSQIYYGNVVHWITIISCLISLIAPVLILMFPDKNLLNPTLLFNAIFEGKSSVEIWETSGVPFRSGEFWKLFIDNIFSPDGFAALGLVLGCSVTLWALIPAIWQFIVTKNYFYVLVSFFVAALILLAMSGIVNMAG